MLKVTFAEIDESTSHKLVIKVTEGVTKCHSLARSVLFGISYLYLTMNNNKPGGLYDTVHSGLCLWGSFFDLIFEPAWKYSNFHQPKSSIVQFQWLTFIIKQVFENLFFKLMFVLFVWAIAFRYVNFKTFAAKIKFQKSATSGINFQFYISSILKTKAYLLLKKDLYPKLPVKWHFWMIYIIILQLLHK